MELVSWDEVVVFLWGFIGLMVWFCFFFYLRVESMYKILYGFDLEVFIYYLLVGVFVL